MFVRFEGFEVLSEDPRLFVVKNKVYALFITPRGMGLTAFEKFEPVLLLFNSTAQREKNWGPFVLNDVVHFVYSYDPLLVLYYDFNPQGILKVAHRHPAVKQVPFDSQDMVLRGELCVNAHERLSVESNFSFHLQVEAIWYPCLETTILVGIIHE
jgi:hypothetical protein